MSDTNIGSGVCAANMTVPGDGYKEPASKREAVRTNDLICHVVRADGLRYCFSKAAVTHR